MLSNEFFFTGLKKSKPAVRFAKMSGDNMKKVTSDKDSNDTMRSGYDFSGGVRGKYAKALKENGCKIRIFHTDGTFSERRVLGDKTVVLDTDVWEYFSTPDAVNNALRTLISLVPKKQSHRSNG